MKKILAIALIGILILTGGCSSAAGSAETSSIAPKSSVLDSESVDTSNTQTRPSDASRQDDQNEVLGKIIAISENNITLAIGTINRAEGMQGEEGVPPDGDGSRPEGGQSRQEPPDGVSRSEGAPAIPDQQRDSSMPQGERQETGDSRGPGGGFSGSSMDLEYTGEEISYTLSDSVEITKGMGENSEKLTASDLAEGDIVRLLLDEAEQPVSIQVFGMNE